MPVWSFPATTPAGTAPPGPLPLAVGRDDARMQAYGVPPRSAQ